MNFNKKIKSLIELESIASSQKKKWKKNNTMSWNI